MFEMAWRAGGECVHFFLGRSHGALQKFLETWNSLQCLAGEIQHVLGARVAVKVKKMWSRGQTTLGAWLRNIAGDKLGPPRAMVDLSGARVQGGGASRKRTAGAARTGNLVGDSDRHRGQALDGEGSRKGAVRGRCMQLLVGA